MNVQVFGFKDCQDTRKALRFFAERQVAVHFVDLEAKPASKGELRRFADRHGAATLIDRESPRFKALGLHVSGDSPQRQAGDVASGLRPSRCRCMLRCWRGDFGPTGSAASLSAQFPASQ